jgi:hypothetical protein
MPFFFTYNFNLFFVAKVCFIAMLVLNRGVP